MIHAFLLGRRFEPFQGSIVPDHLENTVFGRQGGYVLKCMAKFGAVDVWAVMLAFYHLRRLDGELERSTIPLEVPADRLGFEAHEGVKSLICEAVAEGSRLIYHQFEVENDLGVTVLEYSFESVLCLLDSQTEPVISPGWNDPGPDALSSDRRQGFRALTLERHAALPLKAEETRMSRYFFDVHDGIDIRDDEGVDLSSLEEVRKEAIRAAGDMLKDMAELWSGEKWQMEVRDESGKIVATLNFSAS